MHATVLADLMASHALKRGKRGVAYRASVPSNFLELPYLHAKGSKSFLLVFFHPLQIKKRGLSKDKGPFESGQPGFPGGRPRLRNALDGIFELVRLSGFVSVL